MPVRPASLARELVAFLNHGGGTLLIGVENDGSVSGTKRENLTDWVDQICRTKIDPPVFPDFSWAHDRSTGREVLAVSVPRGPDKPYARRHDNRRPYYMRVGASVYEASRAELARMFQTSGKFRYCTNPVPGAGLDDLDRLRPVDYLTRVTGGDAPDAEDREGWEGLLCNLGLMRQHEGSCVPTIGGMLLFGRNPRRRLPNSGVRAIRYPGTERSYSANGDVKLHGPMVPLGPNGGNGHPESRGLVDQAWDFMRLNTKPLARIVNLRRVDSWEFPEAVVRELLVNALVHCDYTFGGMEVTLEIYEDRVEIESPGGLPDGMTVTRMKNGGRNHRNDLLVQVMRDYGYMEARGMGIRSTVIPGMRQHNGTEPEFTDDESRLIVRLWK